MCSKCHDYLKTTARQPLRLNEVYLNTGSAQNRLRSGQLLVSTPGQIVMLCKVTYGIVPSQVAKQQEQLWVDVGKSPE